MNIDLLFTAKNEAGLICSENLAKKAIGVLFDPENGMMSIEYADADHMDLNIPVEEEFYARLDFIPHLHIGAVHGGKIAQAYQVPLMLLNDPYRGEVLRHVQPPQKPLAAFDYFIKSCVFGQPVHRDDAGDEDTLGCILGEAQPANLEFAPHLARRHTFEAAPEAAPSINAPGLGLGGSSGSYTRRGTTRPGDGKNKKDDGKDGK